jgi:type IV pilus biogenesis protein PilP
VDRSHLIKKKTVLAVLFSLIPVWHAFADEAQLGQAQTQTVDGAPIPAGGAEELSVLQSQIAILKARAEIAKLNSDIRAADSGAGSGGGVPMGIPALPPGVVGPSSAKGAQQGVVRPPEIFSGSVDGGVAQISGYDGKFSAKIQTDSGPLSVVNGSKVMIMGEDWVVYSIGSNGVDLVSSGKHPKTMHMGQ